MNEEIGQKSSYRTRSRVSEVLAEARASLKDPSRPFTPASLDERTRIDKVKESHPIDVVGTKPSQKKEKMFKSVQSALSSDSYRVSGSTLAGTDHKQPSKSSNDKNFGLQNLLRDIEELSSTIESEVSFGALKNWKIVESFVGNVEKFTKQCRESDAFTSIGRKSGLVTYDRIVNINELISNLPSTSEEILLNKSKLSCNVVKLSFLVLNIEVKTLSLASTGSSIARNICRCMQSLFEMRDFEVLNSRKDAVYDDLDSDNVHSETKLTFDSKLIEASISSLTHIWNRFPSDFAKEIVFEENNTISEYTDCFRLLLESAVFSVGILRHYSNFEIQRKRLIHMGILSETLSPGLSATVNSVQSYFQGAHGDQNNPFSPETMTGSVIIPLIVKILVQLVASLRNYSLESAGRNQLLQSKDVCYVCTIVRWFPHVPDLLLNCVRVTAKLSLIEPFRTQINGRSLYIKSIAEVVVREAMACQYIMTGNERAGEWPMWHTWPILSRAAFTLGNLTTSNNKNRLLIGTECKILKPLIVLLQACACTITEINKRQGDEEEVEEDVEYVEDGNRLISSSKNTHSKKLDEGDDDNDDEEYEILEEGIETESVEEEGNDDSHRANNRAGILYDDAEQEIFDATVKLLRLLANLSIEGSIGSLLARRIEPFQMLMELLASSVNHEELLLNVVATCTNLTFYACNSNGFSGNDRQGAQFENKMVAVLTSMSVQLSHCLFHDNSELVLESARALGNLTRNGAVLTSLLKHRVDVALILLLEHASIDVVSAVTGAVINISADSAGKESLLTMEPNPSIQLISALKRASLKHINLSILIAQVFHNLLTQDVVEKRCYQSFLSSIPETVENTFVELVECAEELIADSEDHAADPNFNEFVRIGRIVLHLLQ